MTHFYATIRHHSIARARVIECGENLVAAKAKASREFGDDFRDVVITIYGGREGVAPEIYAERKVSARKWTDR